MTPRRPFPRKETARRLRVLANKLLRVPEDRFRMFMWAGDDWAGNPEFQKRGLHLEKTIPGSPFPVYRDYEETHAGEAFFGITKWEAESLFMPHQYPEIPIRNTTVVQRIRALAKEYAKPRAAKTVVR